MSQAKYSVNQHPISIVLAWIEQGEIAIPEIQRPFRPKWGHFITFEVSKRVERKI
jgi:hypothetical protein